MSTGFRKNICLSALIFSICATVQKNIFTNLLTFFEKSRIIIVQDVCILEQSFAIVQPMTFDARLGECQKEGLFRLMLIQFLNRLVRKKSI